MPAPAVGCRCFRRRQSSIPAVDGQVSFSLWPKRISTPTPTLASAHSKADSLRSLSGAFRARVQRWTGADQYALFLNSASLVFTPNDSLAKLADPAAANHGDAVTGPGADKKPGEVRQASATASATQNRREPETAIFAGGCFWCMEAVFEQLKGVSDVESGYCGGTPTTASYERVHSGGTRHAEAIRVTYDPEEISYDQLLDVFFNGHDPTPRNRQGEADVGRQYRSAIFVATSEQKKQAEAKIAHLQESKTFKKRIVTRLEPMTGFYPAEEVHQDLPSKYPFDAYIQEHAIPESRRSSPRP